METPRFGILDKKLGEEIYVARREKSAGIQGESGCQR